VGGLICNPNEEVPLTAVLGDAGFPAEWGDTIPSNAFSGWDGVLKVIIPSRIAHVGDGAFAGCSRLAEIVIPEVLTAIGRCAFEDCFSLSEIALPASLTSLGQNAFARSGLVKAILPPLLTSTCGAFRSCKQLVEVALPSSLRTLGSAEFCECSRLARVNFPDSLTEIGAYAFHGSSLVELKLPNALTSIEANSFGSCAQLRTLILPASLTSLSAGAFKGSTANLQLLVLPLTVPITVAAAVGVLLGPHEEPRRDEWKRRMPGTIVLPSASNIQLVLAPNIVVASLGGAFSGIAAMAEVPQNRVIASALDYQHWTIKTHRHNVCTRSQQLCAYTVLLVGIRLCFQSVPPPSASILLPAARSSLGSAKELSAPATANAADRPHILPALPCEMWHVALGWLRRAELGKV
jgi:hypothetical protein